MHILTKRGSQDNIVTYEHICDTIEDRQYIENKYITLGTVCIVLSGESGGMEIYMADSSKQWHDIMITGDNGEGGSGLELHICTNEEINNGKPAVEFPLEGVLYLVPANNESGNLYDEYLYVNNDWELFGGASVNLAGYATESWVQQQGYLTSSTAIESIPLASTSTAGIIKLGAGLAPIVNMQDPNDESVGVVYADSASIKTGTTAERFITPYMEHAAAFYGLAKAAGDTTQAQSNNAIGTYTTGAKTAIKNMLEIPSSDLFNSEKTVDLIVETTGKQTVEVPISSIASYPIVVTVSGVQMSGEYSIKYVNATLGGEEINSGGTLINASSTLTRTWSSTYDCIKVIVEVNCTATGEATVNVEYTSGARALEKRIEENVVNLPLEAGAGLNALQIKPFELYGSTFQQKATGLASVALGQSTFAIGTGAYAEGLNTLAIGEYSHAEGENTMAATEASHAEGHNTAALGEGGSHSEGWGDISTATVTSKPDNYTYVLNGVDAEYIRIGTAVEWQGHWTSVGAVSAANNSVSLSANWDNVGDSINFYKSTAGGWASHIEGNNTLASYDGAHAEGLGTAATNAGSHAEGDSTIAQGPACHAEGVATTASGWGQHVSGRYNVVDSNGTYAEIVGNGEYGSLSNARTLDWDGNAWYAGVVTSGASVYDIDDQAGALATKEYLSYVSVIEKGTNQNRTATYDGAIQNKPFIYNNQLVNQYASAVGAIALGIDCHADGAGSFASGFGTEATTFAHAEGQGTMAEGQQSHAEGQGTTAHGVCSHAEGYSTVAQGAQAHAEGISTIAGSSNQHVEGKYNISDINETYVHIVGNGTPSTRSNAHTLDWSGNAWYAGKVTADGTPTNANDLTTKQYVDNAINGSTVSVSGTTPTVTAVANTMYVCGEVSTLSFTPAVTGISDIIFESGSTATVLTVPNTVKFPDWFDATALEPNMVYEISIMNGTYGAVMAWATT